MHYAKLCMSMRFGNALYSAPIRASGVKRAWVIGPVAFTVSPGWACTLIWSMSSSPEYSTKTPAFRLWRPRMWVMLSEIFPNEERAAAISVVGFWNSLVSASVTLLFPTELAIWGPAGTFLAYGLLAAAGLLFIVMLAPETKGKTLEELEGILTQPKQALAS